jgi:hypothetical protein
MVAFEVVRNVGGRGVEGGCSEVGCCACVAAELNFFDDFLDPLNLNRILSTKLEMFYLYLCSSQLPLATLALP